MNGKSLFASKTFWVNFVAFIIAAAQVFQGAPWFNPETQSAILAVANIALRILTNQPIGDVSK